MSTKREKKPEEKLDELRNGTSLRVEADPDDDRFVQVIFRRPRAPDEKDVSYQGAEVSLGKFILMAVTYSVGFGLAKMVARGDRLVAMLNYTGIQAYAGETPAAPPVQIILKHDPLSPIKVVPKPPNTVVH